MNRWIPVALSVAAALVLATPAHAFDWNAFADQEVVVVFTRDEDGSRRETKVWLAVVDGRGYIRTGGTTWGGNVTREPHIILRVVNDEGHSDIKCDIAFVTDKAERARVEEGFRTKYGAQDALLGLFRGSDAKIMRLFPGS